MEEEKGLGQLEIVVRGSKEILPGDPVRDIARQLLDAHALRAAGEAILFAIRCIRFSSISSASGSSAERLAVNG